MFVSLLINFCVSIAPGGPGGRGGDGARGGDSGDSANIEIYCKHEDLDLLTSFAQLQNYAMYGGRAGQGGRGGSGGCGGSGGIGCTWTETVQVYDSNTNSYKSETQTHSQPSATQGSYGPEGPSGRDGQPGRDGRAGTIHYIVSKRVGQSPTVTTHSSLYNLHLHHVHFTGVGSGIFEPGQVITINDIFLDNDGGMDSPPHVEIAIHPSSPANLFVQYLNASLRTNTSIPHIVGGKSVITSGQKLQFKILDSSSFAMTDNQLLAIDTDFHLTASLYRTGYVFPAFHSSFPHFPLRIEYPVELSMIAGSKSGLLNSKIPWAVTLKNKSHYPLGNHSNPSDKSKNRLLQIKIELLSTESTSSLITEENFSFNIWSHDTNQYYAHSLTINRPIIVNINALLPLQDLVLQGYLTLSNNAIPMYDSIYLQYSLLLGEISSPLDESHILCIQREYYSVQMTEARKPHLSSQDVLLIINSDNTREEILYWMEIIQSLGFTVNVWNVSLYHGVAYNQNNYSILENCQDTLIIFLNTPFVIPHSSETQNVFQPLHYLQSSDIFEAARRYGIRTYVINGGKGLSASYKNDGDGSDLIKQLLRLSTPLRPSPLRADASSSVPSPSAPLPVAEAYSPSSSGKGGNSPYSPTSDVTESGSSKTTSRKSIFTLTKNEKGEEIFDGRSDFLKSLLAQDRLRYLRDEKLFYNSPTSFQYILIKYYHVFTIPKEQKFHHRSEELVEMLIDYRPDRSYFIKKNYSGPKKTSGSFFKRYDCGEIEVRRGLDHTYAMIASRGLTEKVKMIDGTTEVDLGTQQRQIDRFVILKLFSLSKKFIMLTEIINRPPSATPLTPPPSALPAPGSSGKSSGDVPLILSAPSQMTTKRTYVTDQILEEELITTIVSDIMDEVNVYFSHINKIRYPWKTFNKKLVVKDILTSLSVLSNFALISIPSLTDRRLMSEDLSVQKKVVIVKDILIRVGVINRYYFKTNFIGNSLTPQLLNYLVELYMLYCDPTPVETVTASEDYTKEVTKTFNTFIDNEINRLQSIGKGGSLEDVLMYYQDPYRLQQRCRSTHVFLNHWIAYPRQREVKEFVIAENEKLHQHADRMKASLDDHFADGKVLEERVKVTSENIRYHQRAALPDMSYLQYSDRQAVNEGKSSHKNKWEVL